MIDGIGIADIDNIVALGIDIWGKKQVLGVRQGATENTKVCTELLQDLVGRGLPGMGITCLFWTVAKLVQSGEESFRENAIIQRCQVHKRGIFRQASKGAPDQNR